MLTCGSIALLVFRSEPAIYDLVDFPKEAMMSTSVIEKVEKLITNQVPAETAGCGLSGPARPRVRRASDFDPLSATFLELGGLVTDPFLPFSMTALPSAARLLVDPAVHLDPPEPPLATYLEAGQISGLGHGLGGLFPDLLRARLYEA